MHIGRLIYPQRALIGPVVLELAYKEVQMGEIQDGSVRFWTWNLRNAAVCQSESASRSSARKWV